MKANTTIFLCSHCDAQYQKWTGRCLECGQWGTVKETAAQNTIPVTRNSVSTATPLVMQALTDVQGKPTERVQTRIDELDRVLGGGMAPGSFLLLGGEPGIGKSTLALQWALSVPKTLYISGEESVEQISMRARRIHIPLLAKEGQGEVQSLQLANATNIDAIIATIHEKRPTLAIIDSIQTITSDESTGEAGSITQVRACGAKLMETAKYTGTSIVLIGHVTKDGTLAGPKTLEHLVDTVLYLEGDRYHHLRLLRAVKNRFGGTDEVGIFDMTETGLAQVTNASQLLLDERGDDVPGSIVTCLMEGTRPMLVEIQALVSKTNFGYPVRKASGFDLNRLHVLIAVLERRAGLALGQYDVHVNVVGGIKANEPAADLAVALAIASAYKNKALGKDLAAFGEIGLAGEVRSVRLGEKRIKECTQLGIKRIICGGKEKGEKGNDVQLIVVKNIQELIRQT